MKKTDKPKKAVALGYKAKEDQAPKVVASGKGHIAEKILAVAKANNIPLHEDADLVEVLATLDINQEIPPDMYQAIAEILSFIYKINNKTI